MKYFSLLFIILFLVSCGASVSYDYDSQVNFSNFKSYNYFPNLSSGLSNLDNERVIKATDSILQSRGFVKSSSPQFLINFFVKEYISQSNTSIGFGVGGGGSNGSIGVSGGAPVGGDIINQQFTLDFIDEKEDKLIWQAIGDDQLKVKSNPIQKDQYYFNLISKIIKGFPPKK